MTEGNSSQEISLSIEETNKLRISLGLKPLYVPRAFPVKGESIVQDKDEEAIKQRQVTERIEKSREKRLASQAQTNSYQSFFSDVALSAEDWVKQSRSRSLLSEAKEELKNRISKNGNEAGSKPHAVPLRGAARPLAANIRIAHDVGDFQEGEITTLTLRDRKLLDTKGRALDADDEDELINVNLDDAERQKELLERKKKSSQPVYRGFDDDHSSGKKSLLSQYDDVLEPTKERTKRSGLSLSDYGTVRAESADASDKTRKDDGSDVARINLVQSAGFRVQSDYLTEDVMSQPQSRPMTLDPAMSTSSIGETSASAAGGALTADTETVSADDLIAELRKQREMNGTQRRPPPARALRARRRSANADEDEEEREEDDVGAASRLNPLQSHAYNLALQNAKARAVQKFGMDVDGNQESGDKEDTKGAASDDEDSEKALSRRMAVVQQLREELEAERKRKEMEKSEITLSRKQAVTRNIDDWDDDGDGDPLHSSLLATRRAALNKRNMKNLEQYVPPSTDAPATNIFTSQPLDNRQSGVVFSSVGSFSSLVGLRLMSAQDHAESTRTMSAEVPEKDSEKVVPDGSALLTKIKSEESQRKRWRDTESSDADEFAQVEKRGRVGSVDGEAAGDVEMGDESESDESDMEEAVDSITNQERRQMELMQHGVAAAAQLLAARGEITGRVRPEYRGRVKDARPEWMDEVGGGRSAGDKEIVIDYRDEQGRLLTPKEAFRYLSYKFHGRGVSKTVKERRERKEKRDKKIAEQNSMPVSTVMRNLTAAQQAKGQAYLVLSKK